MDKSQIDKSQINKLQIDKLQDLKLKIEEEITLYEKVGRFMPERGPTGLLGVSRISNDPIYYLADNDTRCVLLELDTYKAYGNIKDVESARDRLRYYTNYQLKQAMPFILAPSYYHDDTFAVIVARLLGHTSDNRLISLLEMYYNREFYPRHYRALMDDDKITIQTLWLLHHTTALNLLPRELLYRIVSLSLVP